MARHSMRHVRARRSVDATRSPRRRRRDPERTDTQVQNVVKILGLRFGTKYTAENIKTLRYGHLMIMTDQDHDGYRKRRPFARPVTFRQPHAIDARRFRERRSWVVSFPILRPFGPRFATTASRAGPTSRVY